MKTTTFHTLIKNYEIRIPLIQRDYAQGREDDRSSRVRRDFLRALKEALTSEKTLHLDFIYGEKDGRTFLPFDGQQRLTTLFLLHWYAGLLDENAMPFTYEVRESARLFCRELRSRLHDGGFPRNGEKLSGFIKDQCWFSPAWRHDPTIAAMLVMLDDMDATFRDVPDLAQRLKEKEPVRFFCEGVSNLGNSPEDIFIKMNARGRLLTDWEHFKAQFLPHLREKFPERAKDIADKLDNDWLDVFWTHFADRNGKEDPAEATDRAFTAFFRHLADMMLALPDPEAPDDAPGDDLFSRMVAALSPSRERLCPRCDNLDFLTQALDALHERVVPENRIPSFFTGFFRKASRDTLPVKGNISLFSRSVDENADLLTCCCEGRAGHADTFLLFACLLALTEGIGQEEAKQRLRILRNLLEHSSHEFVPEYRAAQLKGVYRLMVEGCLDEQSRFNTWQLREEQAKLNLRKAFQGDAELQEALDALEDHPLLRGRIAVFSEETEEEKEALVFERETVLLAWRFFRLAFGEHPVAYDTVLRGLLSFGNYDPPRRKFCLSSHEGDIEEKRAVFCTSPGNREHFFRMRHALHQLARTVRKAESAEEAEKSMNRAAEAWLNACEERLPWRWYFAAYPFMRPDPCNTRGWYSPASGTSLYKTFEWEHLATGNRMGSKMDHRTGNRNGSYWSPFVRAAFELARENGVEGLIWDDKSKPCRLLAPCGLSLTMNECAWIITGAEGREKPLTKTQKSLLERLRALHPRIDEEGYLPVRGKDSEDGVDCHDIQGHQCRFYDTEDRIRLILPVLKSMAELEGAGKSAS